MFDYFPLNPRFLNSRDLPIKFKYVVVLVVFWLAAAAAAVSAAPRATVSLHLRADLGVTTVKPAATPAKPAKIVSGWLPGWSQGDGLQSLQSHRGVINELSPFWYYLNPAGGVSRGPGAGNADVINNARQQHQLIIPTISNAFDGRRVAAVIGNMDGRTRLVNNIVDITVRNGYNGIDIDFENVAADTRGSFTGFTQMLAARLHARGKLLSVTVMPKTSEPGNPYAGGAAAQDYAAVAAAADRVRVMAYDYHYQGGVPGPVAPSPWVEQLIKFAVTVIPRQKLVLGIPTYGYDWAPTGGKTNGRAVVYGKAMQLAAAFKQNVRFDPASQSPTFQYQAGGVNHYVWFENARSLSVKLDIANKYNIAGVVFWSLGKEDPANWAVISNKLIK